MSEGYCEYKCSIGDCLRGLEYAILLGWYSYKSFDLAKWEKYEGINNGYLNWIIPGKLVACSSPSKMEDDVLFL